MSGHTLGLTSLLENYLDRHHTEHPLLTELRERTATHEWARMQIAPNQGAFLVWLQRLIGARRCLEIGVFTGYSSLATALALPSDGRLLACDVNDEWTQMAREFWRRAGVDSKVELRLGPATDTLEALIRDAQSQSFDFAFVDADKENYGAYYELCLRLVRPAGVLVFDNVLWSGSVADETDQRASTRALRELARRASTDPRVDASFVAVADGLLLVRKR